MLPVLDSLATRAPPNLYGRKTRGGRPAELSPASGNYPVWGA